MRDNLNLVWVLGKVHEVFSYGLIATIVCLVADLTSVPEIVSHAFQPVGIPAYYLFYLFWTTVGFFPISVVCAFGTKFGDGGNGLLFTSESIVIIMFGHFFEDLSGLVGTPFWFLRDFFTHSWDMWKIVDYVIYLLLAVFIVGGMALLAVF